MNTILHCYMNKTYKTNNIIYCIEAPFKFGVVLVYKYDRPTVLFSYILILFNTNKS